MFTNRKHQIVLLAAMLAVLAAMQLYQRLTAEPPRTMPLTYTRGMSVSAPVRLGLSEGGGQADPLSVLLARRTGAWPGVRRDLFRLTGTGEVVRPKPAVISKPMPTVTMPTSTVPERSAEEIAAETARADLSRFRFLGYLTDKDSSLFLSKDGELFIVKTGDTILKSYRIKETGKDHVILMDTATKVEVKIELQGSTESPRR